MLGVGGRNGRLAALKGALVIFFAQLGASIYT